ncbi:hypothetical protein [Bacillus nakamurai]|uniref:hypothetical protein n=1 Tax=Bacillus nakamurai TaxID=1793963 RepID=UPI0020C1BD58|nr:hypothetical protein [Bacillus nakamurai]MCP6680961.1 hypothetical protein [Bacillus nakamurai]
MTFSLFGQFMISEGSGQALGASLEELSEPESPVSNCSQQKRVRTILAWPFVMGEQHKQAVCSGFSSAF